MTLEFVEHPAFTKRVVELLTDSWLAELQLLLNAQPEYGKVMPGCGGMRKLRAPDPRRHVGRRGGFRIIYLFVPEAAWIYLIDIYGKDEKDDLDADEKKVLKRLASVYRVEAIRIARTQGPSHA